MTIAVMLSMIGRFLSQNEEGFSLMSGIRIVLVSPSHPGNIGAAARAMKLMDISELYLVSPKKFPDPVATIRATGGADILEKAIVTDTLADALSGCTRVYATSARGRTLSLPTLSARQCAEEVATRGSQQVAIVFGRESSGLTNEELMLAHRAVLIPTSASFSSLNLAQAVQIISYECFVACNECSVPTSSVKKGDELASMQQLAGFYAHLEKTLEVIEFLKPKQSATLMQRLMRLYNRTELTINELNILRGILSDTDRRIKK